MTSPTATSPFPPDATPPPFAQHDEPSLFVEDQYFSVVPEWAIKADVPDLAYRLWTLLLRFGGSTGVRMPSRQRLADDLGRSVDSIDRALRALVTAGMVTVERRRVGSTNLSNRYYVHTSGPRPPAPTSTGGGGGRTAAATPPPQASTRPAQQGASTGARSGGSRTPAATPSPAQPGAESTPAGLSAGSSPGDRTTAATGRSGAARVAAAVRPYPEASTQRTPPPPTPSPSRSGRAARTAEEEALPAVLTDCGLDGPAALADLAARCVAARNALGQPTTRWTAQCLSAALQLAVRGRGWPATLAVPALLAVAGDRETRSPMRLAEAGPWWDQPPTTAVTDPAEVAELADLDRRLDDLDGGRVHLQAAARSELTNEGMPLTRATVLRRACAILDRQQAAS